MMSCVWSLTSFTVFFVSFTFPAVFAETRRVSDKGKGPGISSSTRYNNIGRLLRLFKLGFFSTAARTGGWTGAH